MYYLTSEASFDGAHFLYGYEGKCSNIHGHRWKVVLKFASNALQEDGPQKGMIVDFSDVRDALSKEVNYFDHALIYEKNTLKAKTIDALNDEGFLIRAVDFRPTAENLSKYFFDRLNSYGFIVDEVTVYETPNNSASYRKG